MRPEQPVLAFGAQLKSLRRQQHLTQGTLALRAGVAQSYISALERGVVVNPSRAIIGRLAYALHCCATDLAATNGLKDHDPALSPDPDVRERIRCWPELTPGQQSFLLWMVGTMTRLPVDQVPG